MEDHNTRIVEFVQKGSAARAVAEALTTNVFHNLSYFAGAYVVMNEMMRR